MIKRLFGAAAVIACVSLSAWWLTYHRIAVEDDGLPVVSRDDHRWLDGLYSRNPREVQAATDEVTGVAKPRCRRFRRRCAIRGRKRIGSRARSRRAPSWQAGGACDRRSRRGPAEEGLTTEAAIALSHMGPGAFQPLRNGLWSDDPIVPASRSLDRETERTRAARTREGHAAAAPEHARCRRNSASRCRHPIWASSAACRRRPCPH